MSGKFNGFTSEDIKNYTSNRDNGGRQKLGLGLRRMPDNKIVPPPPTHQNQQVKLNNAARVRQKLHAPTTTAEPDGDDSSSSEITINNNLRDAIHFNPLPAQPGPEDESILQTNGNQESSKQSTTDYSSPFRGMSLKDFESQRRMVEEQNKQKKELLFKTIEQHSERTAAEVKKLQEIKKELAKLDSELAADVAILRKQIENASFHFMQVQRNYQQTEALFIQAKMDMQLASEKKELLTEHLCTIIAHNEDRKSKKLTELMEKVGIGGENLTNE